MRLEIHTTDEGLLRLVEFEQNADGIWSVRNISEGSERQIADATVRAIDSSFRVRVAR